MNVESNKKSPDVSERQSEQSEFARHVNEGLGHTPKFLSSRYIYDAAGSRLFEAIMKLPEYYLTRAEYAILEQRSGEIAACLPAWEHFDVVEFGAGDGSKTRLLLSELARQRAFRYLPVDISAAALKTLETNFAGWMPQLNLVPLQAEYFAAVESLRASGRPRLVLFLGSNIGNFSPEQTLAFLRRLQQLLSPGDCLLTGFDLKKEPARILAAYHDSQGVTREFSRNLLHRINRELGGQFDVESFDYAPSYHPDNGELHAYLYSRRAQTVRIEALGLDVPFAAWETIHTEVSRKYAPADIESLADASGFALLSHFFDPRRDFVDSLWQVH